MPTARPVKWSDIEGLLKLAKSFLVTGSEGFIGSNLRGVLESSGHHVTGLEIGSMGYDDYIVEVQSVFESQNWDGAFHVGANANTLETNIQKIMFENVESTSLISKACKNMKIPLIYSSSAACYGVDGKRPANLYAWTKWIGEQVVLRDGGVSLRYFNVYGPNEFHKGKMASYMHQAFLQAKSGKVPLLFPGNPKRDFIHVEDIVEANLRAWQDYSKLQRSYFDVGTGDARSFEECLTVFGLQWDYFPKSAIPEGYQYLTAADPSRMIPGWRPLAAFTDRVESYLAYLESGVR